MIHWDSIGQLAMWLAILTVVGYLLGSAVGFLIGLCLQAVRVVCYAFVLSGLTLPAFLLVLCLVKFLVF